jgi:hypothetical protein
MGDFLFQSTNMATKKPYSIKWLNIHILVYIACMYPAIFYLTDWETGLKYVLVNGALHWITDFFTSKISIRYRATPRIFFPILGFDQMIHIVTLVLTYQNHQLIQIW